VQALLTSVGTGSPLSVDNSRAFLPVMIQLANATFMRETLTKVLPLNKEALDAMNGVAGARFVALSTADRVTTFSCPGGGTYILDRFSAIGSNQQEYYNQFQSCKIDGATLNGDVLTRDYTFPDNPAFNFRTVIARSARGDFASMRPLTYTYPSGVSVVSAAYLEIGTRNLFSDTVIDTLIRQGDKSLTISELYTSEAAAKPDFSGSVPSYSSFTANVTVSGTLTNNRIIDITTLNPFTNIGAGDFSTQNYNVGLLLAKDRSGGQMSVTVDAAAGGVVVRVDTAGKTTQYTEKWSDTINFIKAPKP